MPNIIQKLALVATSLAQPLTLGAALAAPKVTAQPPAADPEIAKYYTDPVTSPQLPAKQMADLLRSKIKYVFVIFNENHSFDNEYGTFPGVNGLYSDGQSPRSAENTPGFTQVYKDYRGNVRASEPFLLGPEQNATVIDSVDHSHPGLAAKLAVTNGVPTMTGFAQDEYSGKSGSAPTAASDAKGRQFANIVMSHIDCDTIPFLWRYASRFTIFDNIFATEDTPSTPNAIAMIAGQSGETQWVQQGSVGQTQKLCCTINGVNYAGQTGTTQGPPLVNDPQPNWGSEFDVKTKTDREPVGPKEFYGPTNIASNQTYATVPLTAAGTSIRSLMSGDLQPEKNERFIKRDIAAIEAHGTAPVEWRWYENGYDHEPTDPPGVTTHNNFVTHHEGPQYFGYIANNTKEQPNLGGEQDFFADTVRDRLPNGGIIYIRGGYANIQGLQVPIQNASYPRALTSADIAAIRTAKAGDDDHPSYSDRQISEAMNARAINTIASKPAIWSKSAIVLTYDESDGFYDHVPPRILSYGPDGLPLSRGIRVPLIVISPYARVHSVSHAESDHNAVIQTINDIFNLPSLSKLPDEAAALKLGNAPTFNQFGPPGFEQLYLGPRDTNSAITDSLTSGFDPKRLMGESPTLPPDYAIVPSRIVNSLPHYEGKGCQQIGITTEDRRQGIVNRVPIHFNPLASTLPQYNLPAPK